MAIKAATPKEQPKAPDAPPAENTPPLAEAAKPEVKADEVKPADEVKADTKEEKKAPLTPEQIEEQKRIFEETFFGAKSTRQRNAEHEKKTVAEKNEKEQTPAPEEKKKEEDETPDAKPPAKEEEKAEEEKPTPPPPRAKREVQPPIMDAVKVPVVVPEQKKAPEPEDADLTLGEKRELAIMTEMGRMNPSYENLAKRSLQYLKKRSEYVAKWEEKNAGETFDESDSAHKAFFQQWQPVYDEEDFEVARESLWERKFSEKQDRKEAERDRKRQAEQAVREIEPAANVTAAQGVVALVASEPAFEALLKKGDKLVLTEEAVNKLHETDPIAATIIDDFSEPLGLQLKSLHKLFHLPGGVDVAAEHPVRLHRTGHLFSPTREVLQFVGEHEATQLALPAEETQRDGKTLVSLADWDAAMKSLDSGSLSKEQKAAQERNLKGRYYTLDFDDYRTALAANYSNQAKQKIAQFREFVTKGAKAAEKKDSQNQSEEKPKSTAGARVKPPSVDSTSDSMNPPGGGAKKGESFQEALDRAAYGVRK